MIFHHTGQVDGGYASGRGGMSGKYQHTDDLDELIKTWRPEMMLPRAFKDNRHKPMEIPGLSEGGFIMMTGSMFRWRTKEKEYKNHKKSNRSESCDFCQLVKQHTSQVVEENAALPNH